MSCKSPSDQTCFYPQTRVPTVENEASFGPLDLVPRSNCTPKKCTDQPSRIWAQQMFQNACPSGYVIDPEVLKNPCAYAQTVYATSKLNPIIGCPLKYYQLSAACIPQDPNINAGDQALCCSSGLDCPNKAKGLPCCPKDLCPQNDACGQVMIDSCNRTGYNGACKFYIQNSPNEKMRQKVSQSLISNILSKNNVPLDQQPELSTIAEICQGAPPGTCDGIMKAQCKNFTREQIAANPLLIRLCGCFMNSENYQRYKYLLGTNSSGQLLTQCDPLCMNAFADQPGTNCQFSPCNSPICIIDFSNKNVQEQWAAGNDISQTCIAVGTDPSKCFIGMSKEQAKIYLSKSVNIQQKCDLCFLWDPSNPSKDPIKLDCNDPVAGIANIYGLPIPKPSSSIALYIGIGIVIVILIVILIIEFFVWRK